MNSSSDQPRPASSQSESIHVILNKVFLLAWHCVLQRGQGDDGSDEEHGDDDHDPLLPRREERTRRGDLGGDPVQLESLRVGSKLAGKRTAASLVVIHWSSRHGVVVFSRRSFDIESSPLPQGRAVWARE